MAIQLQLIADFPHVIVRREQVEISGLQEWNAWKEENGGPPISAGAKRLESRVNVRTLFCC